jgi:hypothetical protein
MRWITLDVEPEPVASTGGLVYSTAPKTAVGEGKRWFIKGPDPVVVIAESLGYALADLVGLRVPTAALCRVPNVGICFASEECRQRGVEQFLGKPIVVNPDFLPRCIVFDVWTGNADRNVNNLVAEPVGGRGEPEVELCAIDFEKAEVLRGKSQILLETHDPRGWWPRGVLGTHCRALSFPTMACAAVRDVPRDAIEGVFAQLPHDLDGTPIAWAEAGVHHLTSRCRRIEQLVREIWP